MKKMTALLLASVMTASLAACGGNDDDDAASSGPGTQITAASRRFWASAMPMQSCQPWS